MRIVRHFFLIFFLCSLKLVAQNQWATNYKSAKTYLDSQRYDAAKQILIPIIKDTINNSYQERAMYLMAYALYKQGDFLNSKTWLLQLKAKLDDASLYEEITTLLASNYMYLNQYFMGIKTSYEFASDTLVFKKWKKAHYPFIQPIDTLKKVQRAYPLDYELAKELYARVKLNEKEKELTSQLQFQYGFKNNATEFLGVKKSSYDVALLLPFNVKNFDSNSASRSNQYIYDFYQGFLLAIDSLNIISTQPIRLHIYDVDKDLTKLNTIIKSTEFKSIDMVVGPVFGSVFSYAITQPELKNKVVVNPFSLNNSFSNPNTFIYNSSIETNVSAMLKYAKQNFVLRQSVAKDDVTKPKKQVVILYGKEVKDSIWAYHYKDSLKSAGFELKQILKVDYSYVSKLNKLLYDSLGLLKMSHIAAFSSDAVFAANFISQLEITKQSVPFFCYSNWLENAQLSYPQLEKRNAYFINDYFIDFNSEYYKNFVKQFISKSHVIPSKYVLHGYELAYVFGQALQQSGTNIQVYFNQQNNIRVGMLGAYNYAYSNNNQYVPITSFKDKKLIVVNEINP
jgi:hypothetical protein